MPHFCAKLRPKESAGFAQEIEKWSATVFDFLCKAESANFQVQSSYVAQA
jgi:hypothetical protein